MYFNLDASRALQRKTLQFVSVVSRNVTLDITLNLFVMIGNSFLFAAVIIFGDNQIQRAND